MDQQNKHWGEGSSPCTVSKRNYRSFGANPRSPPVAELALQPAQGRWGWNIPCQVDTNDEDGHAKGAQQGRNCPQRYCIGRSLNTGSAAQHALRAGMHSKQRGRGRVKAGGGQKGGCRRGTMPNVKPGGSLYLWPCHGHESARLSNAWQQTPFNRVASQTRTET